MSQIIFGKNRHPRWVTFVDLGNGTDQRQSTGKNRWFENNGPHTNNPKKRGLSRLTPLGELYPTAEYLQSFPGKFEGFLKYKNIKRNQHIRTEQLRHNPPKN
ncbi:MAG: hypothetical protein CM15mP2_3730 [Methanobacteriota archaeon]|nr:MAG: hypothetical protein CM15mP2_3730 [Euryarchaeota archaeon]